VNAASRGAPSSGAGGTAAAARALLERVLSGAGASVAPGTMEREQPLVFDPRFRGELLAVEEHGETRAACTLLVREFVIEDERVRGGLIGSVATDPEHRSRGHATRLLQAAEGRLRDQGCLFALLWADDEGFYARRGWQRIGAELDFCVTRGVLPQLPRPAGIRAARPSDFEALHALYSRHPVRIERSAEESAALYGCPDMRTLVLERERRVQAYACQGRGRDLRGVVHEWAGSASDVAALVRRHFELSFALGQSSDDALWVMAPPSALELLATLSSAGAEAAPGILGLGKLLDRRSAADLLQRRVAPAGGRVLLEPPAALPFPAPDEPPRPEDERPFRVQGPERSTRLGDAGVLALLFPTPALRPAAEETLRDLGLARARLPLEPYAFGLDSI
jgi:GNAT superfamily N-acetyltransferase